MLFNSLKRVSTYEVKCYVSGFFFDIVILNSFSCRFIHSFNRDNNFFVRSIYSYLRMRLRWYFCFSVNSLSFINRPSNVEIQSKSDVIDAVSHRYQLISSCLSLTISTIQFIILPHHQAYKIKYEYVVLVDTTSHNEHFHLHNHDNNSRLSRLNPDHKYLTIQSNP